MAVCPQKMDFTKIAEGWTGSWGSVIVWERDSGPRRSEIKLEPSWGLGYDVICSMIWICSWFVRLLKKGKIFAYETTMEQALVLIEGKFGTTGVECRVYLQIVLPIQVSMLVFVNTLTSKKGFLIVTVTTGCWSRLAGRSVCWEWLHCTIIPCLKPCHRCLCYPSLIQTRNILLNINNRSCCCFMPHRKKCELLIWSLLNYCRYRVWWWKSKS